MPNMTFNILDFGEQSKIIDPIRPPKKLTFSLVGIAVDLLHFSTLQRGFGIEVSFREVRSWRLKRSGAKSSKSCRSRRNFNIVKNYF